MTTEDSNVFSKDTAIKLGRLFKDVLINILNVILYVILFLIGFAVAGIWVIPFGLIFGGPIGAVVGIIGATLVGLFAVSAVKDRKTLFNEDGRG